MTHNFDGDVIMSLCMLYFQVTLSVLLPFIIMTTSNEAILLYALMPLDVAYHGKVICSRYSLCNLMYTKRN